MGQFILPKQDKKKEKNEKKTKKETKMCKIQNSTSINKALIKIASHINSLII